MESLVTDLLPPANRAKLHTYIQWSRSSDMNPPNSDVYDQYHRGEQRRLATHSCYDIATKTKLSLMSIFAMSGHLVDHKAVFVLLSLSASFEQDRFTRPNLLKIVEASDCIGWSARHFTCFHRITWTNTGYGHAFAT